MGGQDYRIPNTTWKMLPGGAETHEIKEYFKMKRRRHFKIGG
jgi:hypothetical protein